MDRPRAGTRSAAARTAAQVEPSRRRGLVYRALTGAVALAVFGGCGYYAWTAYTGERQVVPSGGEVVTIQASAEPLKTAPDDPGGLSVPAGEYAFFDEIDGERIAVRPDEESVLPPPEEPISEIVPDVFDQAPSIPVELYEAAMESAAEGAQPAVTQAEGPAPAQAGVSVPPVLVAPMLPLPQLTEGELAPQPVAQATNVTADPAATAVAAAAQVAAVEPAAAAPQATQSAPAGTATVQLASMRSQDLAQQEWSRLRRLMPDLLGSREPLIRQSTSGDRTYFRVSVAAGGAIEAAALCAEIKNRNFDCIVHN
ncbi:MAG: SPOR domain-containing protein [Alphaproteobacteria bacterium]